MQALRLLTVIALGGGFAWVSAPAMASSADDKAVAESAVLSAGDVPAGFGEVRAIPVDPGQLPKPCSTVAKSEQAMIDAPHEQSAFELDGAGHSVIESDVAVWSGQARARSAFSRFRGAKAMACLSAQLEERFDGAGVTVDVRIGTFRPEIDSKGNEKVIEGGDAFIGYSGSIRTDAGGDSQFFEFVGVVTRVGRGLGRIFIVTDGVVPQGTAQELTQQVVAALEAAD